MADIAKLEKMITTYGGSLNAEWNAESGRWAVVCRTNTKGVEAGRTFSAGHESLDAALTLITDSVVDTLPETPAEPEEGGPVEMIEE